MNKTTKHRLETDVPLCRIYIGMQLTVYGFDRCYIAYSFRFEHRFRLSTGVVNAVRAFDGSTGVVNAVRAFDGALIVGYNL